MNTWVRGLLFIFALATGPLSVRAQYSEDERFLAKLRASRLFDLADDVCRAKLSASNLTPRERVTFTIERMLVQTEKGVNAPLAERPAAFAAARDIAKEFLLNHADNSRGVLVRFQDALTVLTIGELQRLEAELGTSSPADIETAKTTLREAVNLLEVFDADLQKKIPEARRVTKDDEAISADELASLRSHVGFQLARAARNQALLYPEKGEDRTASLLRGKRQLEETVLAMGEAEPIHWLASIELITFERMLNDTARASKLLEDLEAQSPPALAIAPLRAEQIRLLAASGKAAAAVSEGTKWAGAQNPRDADVDLALLEAIVAENSIATTSKSLMQSLADIESKHGPYWGRRASALVLKNAPAEMAAGNLELLSRTADQLYLQQNWDEAIATYDRAAQKAKEEKKDAQFVDLANRAALVEQERKGYSEAVRRFLELAAAPEAKSIADVLQLCAAWNQKQLVEANPADVKIFVAFEQILKDQITKSPDSPSTSKGRLWLAQAYEKRNELDSAYRIADAIPSDANEKDAGRVLCLRYWSRKSSGFDHGKIDNLSAPLKWARENQGDLATTVQRRIGVTGIGWELLYRREPNHGEAESRLRDLISKTPETEKETIDAARTLMVVALAAQPTKHEEAAKLLAESGGTAKQRLTALLGLVKIMKSAGRSVKPALAEFVLTAIKSLSPSMGELNAGEKLLVDIAYADGLQAKGDAKTAQVYAEIAKKHANSAVAQEAYAMYLTSEAETGIIERTQFAQKALDQWRLVASRSEPRSERWFRAKYFVAKTQFQMGDKINAAKLIDLLDATPPGLKGAAMEEEFRALRKLCDTATPR